MDFRPAQRLEKSGGEIFDPVSVPVQFPGKCPRHCRPFCRNAGRVQILCQLKASFRIRSHFREQLLCAGDQWVFSFLIHICHRKGMSGDSGPVRLVPDHIFLILDRIHASFVSVLPEFPDTCIKVRHLLPLDHSVIIFRILRQAVCNIQHTDFLSPASAGIVQSFRRDIFHLQSVSGCGHRL